MPCLTVLQAVAASIVHPFNNNWNSCWILWTGQNCKLQSYILSTTTETLSNTRKPSNVPLLQSYILSTTTETLLVVCIRCADMASIVHPFNNNWNFISDSMFMTLLDAASIVHPFNNNWNLSIERPTTRPTTCFNRTSFQQQLKLTILGGVEDDVEASIVHPFNNNWNVKPRASAI